MKKYLLLGIVGTVALVAIAKTTNLSSYASTFFNQVQRDAAKQVPTKFELERIRNEIASLDGDISQMIRPIAEYKAEIRRVRDEATAAQKNIDEKKTKLLAHLDKLEKLDTNTKFVTFNESKISVERYKSEIQRQTELVKSQELNLKTKRQVLEAKEKALTATQEQLAKVVSKKREYETRVAELEAMDQSLQVARIASDIKIDTSRTTQIEDSLRKIEDKLRADANELDMHRNEGGAALNLFEQEAAPFDLNAARNFLEGEGNGKVANNK